MERSPFDRTPNSREARRKKLVAAAARRKQSATDTQDRAVGRGVGSGGEGHGMLQQPASAI